MVAALQTTGADIETYAHLLEPDILVDGEKPEQRAVYSGISWKRYLAIDKERGQDWSVPKFFYLDGDLEIMSTSGEHERLKTILGGLIEVYFEECEIEIVPRGEATMWLEVKKAGAEPDQSWCLERAKKFPDIVLEIALTSGGVNKLELYGRFPIPEVWIWREGTLEFYFLTKSGEYEKSARSKLVPTLEPALPQRCVKIESWLEARRTFRAGLAKTARSHAR